MLARGFILPSVSVFLSSTLLSGEACGRRVCGAASVGAKVRSWDHRLRGKTGATGPGATFQSLRM
jgi:hypothetical protein